MNESRRREGSVDTKLRVRPRSQVAKINEISPITQGSIRPRKELCVNSKEKELSKYFTQTNSLATDRSMAKKTSALEEYKNLLTSYRTTANGREEGIKEELSCLINPYIPSSTKVSAVLEKTVQTAREKSNTSAELKTRLQKVEKVPHRTALEDQVKRLHGELSKVIPKKVLKTEPLIDNILLDHVAQQRKLRLEQTRKTVPQSTNSEDATVFHVTIKEKQDPWAKMKDNIVKKINEDFDTGDTFDVSEKGKRKETVIHVNELCNDRIEEYSYEQGYKVLQKNVEEIEYPSQISTDRSAGYKKFLFPLKQH